MVAQDIPDWALKYPEMSRIYTTGEYVPLPQVDNYVNPNTQTRVIYANGEVYTLPPNIRPYPHTATQSEVDAVTQGGNGNVIYASWNSYYPSFYGTGFCFSSNGGTNWTGNYIMNGYPPNSGDPGPWVWPTGYTYAGRLGISYISGASYSTNNGTTWTGHVAYTGGSSFDKNLSDVDDFAGSPYFGRAYTVWTYFSTNRIYISYTTNGGQSWSTGAVVSPTPSTGHHHQGCDVDVGPGGVVNVVWANCTTNGQNSTEDYLGFARSTDGGVTWTNVNDFAADMNGIRTSNLLNGIRANGFPRLSVDRTSGALYAVACEKNFAPALDNADVVLMKSTNNGVNWTRTRVNSDAAGKLQWFAAVEVDAAGGVNIVYYDQRNVSSTQAQVYLSRSTNGGTTFTDVQVSDHTFTPAPISGLAGGYQGDYIGICSGNNIIWPFWADNSSGIYQVWTEKVLIGPPPAHDIVVGPWLSFPSQFVAGTAYTMRTKVTNGGTSSETNVPIKWWVNSVLTNTTNLNMTPGKVDSVSNSWTPAAAGNYTLMYCSGLSNDENRNNDTIRTTVTVLPSGTQIKGATVCRNNVNKYLPDNSTVRDTLIYNDPIGLTLVDVNVKIDTFYHTWTGDVAFQISHLGSSDALITNRGGSGDNVIGCTLNDSASTPISSGSPPFTGSFRPESPLSVFNTLNVNGAWILVMTDNASGDTGLLKAWCLQLTYYTLVGGIKTVEIPNYYSLQQNYPNPFNPVTTITYTLPSAGDVKLVVYDMLGRVVRTLVNEKKDVGVYRQEFDAMNLASGVYFYKLEITDASGKMAFSDVKKMMVVK
jgi:hypothetical protein